MQMVSVNSVCLRQTWLFVLADNKDRFVGISHVASENEAQQDNNKFLSEFHFILLKDW